MAESRRRRAAGLALLTIEVPLGAVEDAVAEAALLPAHALDDLTRLAEAVGRVVTAWANGEPPPTVARNTTPGAEGR